MARTRSLARVIEQNHNPGKISAEPSLGRNFCHKEVETGGMRVGKRGLGGWKVGLGGGKGRPKTERKIRSAKRLCVITIFSIIMFGLGPTSAPSQPSEPSEPPISHLNPYLFFAD